jgi:serine/threonine-protein kinase
VSAPSNEVFTGTTRRIVDVSPDGMRLAFVANGNLYVQELSAVDPRVIVPASTVNIGNPTFGPDSQAIVYTTIPGPVGQVKRVSVLGGASVTLADIGATFGMRWDEYGVVLGQGTKGIVRIPLAGGSPEVIAAAGPDEMLGSPQILPGGRMLLYTVKKTADSWDSAQIVAQPLGGGERTIIIPAGTDGRYLPTGHLAYMSSGVLLAVPFDLDGLEVRGAAAPVVEGVRTATGAALSGSAQLSISSAAVLAYMPGPVIGATSGVDLAYFDRQGNSQPLKLPPARYAQPRVSRDGRLVAVETDDGKEAIIWVHELSGSTSPRRLTFGGSSRAPVWSPNGEWIAFQSDRNGERAIYRQRADGSGVAERIIAPERGTEHLPEDWSRDGERLLMSIRRSQQGSPSGWSSQLAVLTLRDGRLSPIPETQSTAMLNGAFSPDGRWIAYQGLEATLPKIYVQPFPPTGVKYQVTLAAPNANVVGAGHPMWSPKGDELIVNSGVSRSAIIPLRISPSFASGRQIDLPRGGRFEPNPNTSRRNADLMPDGERVIGVLPPDAQGTSTNELLVVLNWFNELRQRVSK